MFRSTDNININLDAESDKNYENPDKGDSFSNQNNKNSLTLNQDLNSKSPPMGKTNEESSVQDNFKEEQLIDNRHIMTKDELECLIENKRSELDLRIFDLVTKNQIEEKKLEELCNNENNEEQRLNLLRNLEEAIKNNENKLALLKE